MERYRTSRMRSFSDGGGLQLRPVGLVFYGIQPIGPARHRPQSFW